MVLSEALAIESQQIGSATRALRSHSKDKDLLRGLEAVPRPRASSLKTATTRSRKPPTNQPFYRQTFSSQDALNTSDTLSEVESDPFQPRTPRVTRSPPKDSVLTPRVPQTPDEANEVIAVSAPLLFDSSLTVAEVLKEEFSQTMDPKEIGSVRKVRTQGGTFKLYKYSADGTPIEIEMTQELQDQIENIREAVVSQTKK